MPMPNYSPRHFVEADVEYVTHNTIGEFLKQIKNVINKAAIKRRRSPFAVLGSVIKNDTTKECRLRNVGGIKKASDITK